jgi:hypothetical protein
VKRRPDPLGAVAHDAKSEADFTITRSRRPLQTDSVIGNDQMQF